MTNNIKKWVIIVPILLGIVLVLVLKQNKGIPEQTSPRERAQQVRVITATPATVVPQVRGYGSVRPGKSWEAVAQVTGRILEKHPGFEKGAILEAGSLLLQIDPTNYRLAIAQTEADIEATRAQLLELDASMSNTQASLKIEQQSLALSKKELERKERLVGKGTISHSDLESQKRSLLAQQQSVQSQKNTLNLIPSQRALLEAQLSKQQAVLSSAKRDLENTRITLPFAGRVAEVNVEQEQYVRVGEKLAVVDDLELAEIEAQIPIGRVSELVQSSQSDSLDLEKLAGTNLSSRLGLQTTVRLQEGELSASWDARFARFSDTFDPKTRTIGVIVEVDAPYSQVQPGIRPPLVKGLFLEVNLAGNPMHDRLVIPRSALHQGQVYVINENNRLEIREVKTTLLQPEFAVIASGISEGERIVISDLIPAIEGMLLAPHDDQQAAHRLKQMAEARENR